jgi:hypothetical protein
MTLKRFASTSAITFFFFGCSESAEVVNRPPPPTGEVDVPGDEGGANHCNSGSDLEGCACVEGETQACGACGTRTCTFVDRRLQWSACQECGIAPPRATGTTVEENENLAPQTCAGECMPGTARWCHAGDDECSWGQQPCNTDGSWGECAVTTAPADCGEMYDQECCVAAGQCCQDYYRGGTIGACAGISCR